MASSSPHLPAFEEILKRGAASEPRMVAGSSKKTNGDQTDVSLKAAVESAQAEKLKKENLVRRGLLSATEPRGKKTNKKKRFLDEDAGFSSESSPGQSRRRTPMTMPRTKITPSTPLEQRVALNRLKQRLFDDAEDKQKEGSANKENGVASEEAPPRRENGTKHSKKNGNIDTVSISSIASDFNSDASEMIDTDKIKERLNQVREYLRQATSMYVNLSMSEADEPSRSEQMSKLAKLIQQLRIQEQGYIDLLQRTLSMDDKESVADAASVASLEQQVASMGASSVADVADQKNTLAAQRQEIQQLREQRALLQKIVSQEKQLQELKERQSSLLQMQKDAEEMIELSRNGQSQANDNILNNQRQQPPVERKPSKLSEANILSATQNIQRSINEQEKEDATLSQADASQKRLVLENRLLMLQEKKQQMDSLLGTLKALTNSQKMERSMMAVLDDEQAVSEVSDAVSYTRNLTNGGEAATGDIQGKLQKLNDVRGRLQELRGIVADYETEPVTSTANNESRDNRVTAQALHQKEGNTISGAGGARLRFPDGSSHPLTRNELRALQNELENMLDNRNRPMPPADQSRTQIDMMRNQHSTASSKNKTNAKKSNQTLPKKEINKEIQKKVKELQKARERLAKEEQQYSDTTSQTTTSQTGEDSETSDTESESSSVMQWQEDPEFQAKVRKLQMAKEKLHHLQELVNIVQQGGGPQLPIDDLADLALSLDESVDQYGESEEEGDEEADDEEDEEAEDEESEDEEEDEEEEESQATATSTSVYASNPHFSNNERLYEEMVKKQRQELDSLLKEREQLLEAQRKLAVLSGPTSVTTHTQTPPKSAEKNTQTSTFLPLTREEVSKQNSKQSSASKKSLINKLSNMSVEPQFGSEIEYQRNQEMERRRLNRMADNSIDRGRMDNDSESAAAVPLRTNAMVVSEIRRQREMFEQKKKQKFVEKQQRKKAKKKDNHLDDQATYSVHSDIDEGVGVSMFSADVTTAATWGGSTEQSSSDSDDSAVYEEEEDDDQEEDETAQGDNDRKEDEVPPLFNVKKYDDRPRRNISWLSDEVPGKKRKLEKKQDNYRGAGSVSWSIDVSPPRSRDHPRQGNLTPAYKLMQDRERSRQQIESHLSTDGAPSEQLHSQLVSMCTSLLRNEQTLLAMLQSQNSTRWFTNTETSRQPMQLSSDNVASRNIREFFQHANANDTYEQTLRGLRMCYDRVEGHQRDLRYLQRQFSDMNIGSVAHEEDAPADSSMWVEPPSLHFSNFGTTSVTETSSSRADGSPGKKRRKVKKSKYDTDIPSCLKSGLTIPDSKETQTENSLFHNQFISQNQGYSLFGNTSLEGGLSPNQHTKDNFYGFNEQQGSPGAIGQKLDSSQHDFDPDPVDEYYARVSEYNPLSYADNFPSTLPANVVTTSYLSMEKERSNTMTSEQKKETTIWPSFFKQTDVSVKDESDSSVVKQNIDDIKLDAGADSGSNYSLFEALRDSIYSEVATLISMNESRPHYLIELFRELQLLTSDYLRQRALYALQEVVTRFLTDENLGASPQKPAHFQHEKFAVTSQSQSNIPYQGWIVTPSEQTPSESVLTTDDEDEASALQALARQIHNNEVYDYAELADSQSEENISTPSLADHPFASEDLGSTVINLDEALEKMRTYERNMAEAKRAFEAISMDVRNSTPASVKAEVERKQKAAYEAVKRRVSANMDTVSNSSAGDVASETSSEMPQPSIDTQKLDKQIKAVMRDLIPFLNDNMDTSCTDVFLAQVKDKIVELAKLKEPDCEREEFGRFFHKQLETILQDALLKFSGRKLKECGEDVLIDVSEILFNELAFFKLMQDLDRPLYYGGSAAPYLPKDSTYDSKSEDEEGRVPHLNLHEFDDASSVADSDLDNQINAALAKDVAKICMDDDEEEEEGVESHVHPQASSKSVNLELSVSESKAVNCSGSGEDDDDEGDAPSVSVANGLQSVAQQATVHSAIGQGMNQEEEVDMGREQQIEAEQNAEPVEVQQAEPEDERGAAVEAQPNNDQPEHDQAEQDQPEQDQAEQDQPEHDQAEQDQPEQEQVEQDQPEHDQPEQDRVRPDVNAEQDQVEDENAEDERNVQDAAPQAMQGAVAAEGAVGGDDINGMDEEVENEETEESRDSRPTKLEEYTEADFQAHMASDENAANAVLAHINEVHREELAGDPNVLPEPGQPAAMNGVL